MIIEKNSEGSWQPSLTELEDQLIIFDQMKIEDRFYVFCRGFCTSAYLFIYLTKSIMLQSMPYTTIELLAGRSLFKKGDDYSTFYQLVSGELSITISQNSICISDPIFFGDYQIIQKVDYRLSTIKAITNCIIRQYDLKYYGKINLYHKEIERTFVKFDFRSKNLRYWIKKLFFINHSKRNQLVGEKNSLGVIIQGNFRVDRNIPIVRMKEKQFQLLKKFEICLMSAGQIFSGNLVCQSIFGIVGVCSDEYVQQLARSFEEFARIQQIAQFKGEVHKSMEKQIARNCKKKPRLYENMVPYPLKDHVKPAQIYQTQQKQHNTSRNRQKQEVFRLENNISQFLHKQWRKGLSLSIHRKEVSPPSNKLRKVSKGKIQKKKYTVDINNPILVTLDKFQEWKKNAKTSRTKMQHFSKPQLPNIRPMRIHTEGNEQNVLKSDEYFKCFKHDTKCS